MINSQTSQQANTASFIYKQRLAASFVKETAFSSRVITSSRDSFSVAMNFWEIDSIPVFESVYALYLNRANVPVCFALIGQGGISGCVADIKLIIAHALLAGASALVLFHNHPSGNLIVSHADKELTRKLKAACEVMDLNLLDHLVIAPVDDNGYQSYFSFADAGTL